MYVLEYLLYHLRPYGIASNSLKATSNEPTTSSSLPTQSGLSVDVTESADVVFTDDSKSEAGETRAASSATKKSTSKPSRKLVTTVISNNKANRIITDAAASPSTTNSSIK